VLARVSSGTKRGSLILCGRILGMVTPPEFATLSARLIKGNQPSRLLPNNIDGAPMVLASIVCRLGFYAPAQIVRDAREHGIEVRSVCINASRWDCTLEPTEDEDRFAVRLGLRLVKGLANAHAAAIVAGTGGSVLRLGRRSLAPVRCSGCGTRSYR
jgi:hypothetical protein